MIVLKVSGLIALKKFSSIAIIIAEAGILSKTNKKTIMPSPKLVSKAVLVMILSTPRNG